MEYLENYPLSIPGFYTYPEKITFISVFSTVHKIIHIFLWISSIRCRIMLINISLSTVIHTRTATPHHRPAHHYPPPSTKDTIAASTMHTHPTSYAQIIHPNTLLYVDITALIHNRLQSYPQSAKQFYTTVDNVFHNSRYLYPHLSAHRADTTAHVFHTLCTAFSTPLHRFSTAIARFIHRLYTRYPHLSTTYPQHRRLFHRLYRAIHSHTQPLFAHLSTILSTRLSTLTSVINTPLRLAIALLRTSFAHPYDS